MTSVPLGIAVGRTEERGDAVGEGGVFVGLSMIDRFMGFGAAAKACTKRVYPLDIGSFNKPHSRA